MRPIFYHSTTKKIIVAFATIFDNIRIMTEGVEVKVPIMFSPKEHFVDSLTTGMDESLDAINYDIIFPAMGFEVTGFSFASERHLNPTHQWLETMDDGSDVSMYNRIPYDINISLYIGTKKLDDMLRITEQIWPYFTPELTVTINDKADFKTETNVPIILNSSSINIDYEGSLDQRRTIMGQMDFTAKAYFYPLVTESKRIKETIMSFTDEDFNLRFAKLTSKVVPVTAGPEDPYTIVDTVEELCRIQ